MEWGSFWQIFLPVLVAVYIAAEYVLWSIKRLSVHRHIATDHNTRVALADYLQYRKEVERHDRRQAHFDKQLEDDCFALDRHEELTRELDSYRLESRHKFTRADDAQVFAEQEALANRLE